MVLEKVLEGVLCWCWGSSRLLSWTSFPCYTLMIFLMILSVIFSCALYCKLNWVSVLWQQFNLALNVNLTIEIPWIGAGSGLLFLVLGKLKLFHFIVCFPGCDVINFEINLIFLIKPFFYMTKKSRQKFKYFENGKSFLG